jgi:anti-sigma factor RsiW
MSEHFSTKQVEHYLQRAMTPAELLAADDHLAACSACRERLTQAKEPSALVASLRAGLRAEAREVRKHLAYEQLAAYVDDRMGDVDREIVDSHLAVCSRCGEEMRDLFAFRETLSSAPLAAPAAQTAPSLRERLLSPVRMALGQSPLRLAGGVAALTLIALAVTLWIVWKSSATKPGTQEIVKTQPSPQVFETPTPTAATPTPLPQTAPPQNADTSGPQPTPQSVAPPVNRPPRRESPDASREIVVALNDGGRKLTLDNQGQLTGLDNLSPAEQQAVRAALLTGRAPASSELTGLGRWGDETLMGAPGGGRSLGLQSPVGIVLRTETPTFRWSAPDGATRYTVNVFDAEFNRVMTSGAVSKNEWTAPRALPRGAVYSWQVTAVVGGKEIQAPVPPAPEARFRVLGRAQEDSLRRAEQLYAGEHLTLGVLYSRAGLLDEAEREFRALLAANPDSQVAKNLLRNIELLKGRK